MNRIEQRPYHTYEDLSRIRAMTIDDMVDSIERTLAVYRSYMSREIETTHEGSRMMHTAYQHGMKTLLEAVEADLDRWRRIARKAEGSTLPTRRHTAESIMDAEGLERLR